MTEENQSVTCFSGHEFKDLHSALKRIVHSDLPVEMFDAFLCEYRMTHDLDKSLAFAASEWDC